MVDYIIRRLLMALLVVVMVSIAIFVVMHMLPGDPLYLYLGEDTDVSQLTEEQLQAFRHELGLDKSLPEQYFSWAGSVLHGDFGDSIIRRKSVLACMEETYPLTICLGLYSFILSTIIGIVVGLITGLKRGKFIDQITTALIYTGIATPNFWLAILLIFVFGLQLRLLPMYGFVLPTEDLWLSIKQAIMPVICLSVPAIAATARQMRTSLIEVIRQDYIRTAYAKGLKETKVVSGHALKNSLIPVITIIGMNVRNIFGGSVIVEQVFSIPGQGKLLLSSIFGHDYMVVQSLTLIMVVVVVISNLIVDLSYGWLDPRIRYS